MFLCCPCVVAHSTTVWLTLHSQDEALFDGHSQGLMGDAACELSPWVPEWGFEVEESRQRVGLVLVVFVAGQQDVREHLGERSAHPLAWHCWVLHVPNYLHIQRVVTLCLTGELLLRALLQWEGGGNVEGDARRLWGEGRITRNDHLQIRFSLRFLLLVWLQLPLLCATSTISVRGRVTSIDCYSDKTNTLKSWVLGNYDGCFFN